MKNDTRLFVLIPKAMREDAKRKIDEAFVELGQDFVNFDPEWSHDGGATSTHYAAELPIPSLVVTRFSLAIVYRELFPEPVEGDGFSEEFRGDTFIARYDAQGRVVCLLFAHKTRVAGVWHVLHPRDETCAALGCVPYSEIPPI